jgi:putative membrane protein insertion efficiency factor
MKFLLLPLIKVYQWVVSPILGSNCRHIPTCSEYTYEAIKYHGAIKGAALGAKRISKCHPWSEQATIQSQKKLKQFKYL